MLEILKEKEQASARDIFEILIQRRDIAYTTVSTTLDRLYRKRLVERKPLPGPGGIKYLFFPGRDERAKIRMVGEVLDRLMGAFGDTAYSSFYKRIGTLPDDKLAKLRKEVAAAKRSRSGT